MKKTSKPTRRSPKRSAGPASAVAEALGAFAAVAATRGLRWYLFGAQAVTLHGVARASADIDITVEDPGSVRGLVRDLAARGFAIRVADPERFVRETRVLPTVHGPSGWPVDIVVAGPGLEDGFLERAQPIRLGAVDVPVISPMDLIVTKVLAGRPKDLEDVRGILRRRTVTIALEPARALLREIEEALGRRDLVAVLDELAAATAATRRTPARPRRRGSTGPRRA